MQSQDPGRYELGSKGWVKVSWTSDRPPSLELLERWIGESYGLFAG